MSLQTQKLKLTTLSSTLSPSATPWPPGAPPPLQHACQHVLSAASPPLPQKHSRPAPPRHDPPPALMPVRMWVCGVCGRIATSELNCGIQLEGKDQVGCAREYVSEALAHLHCSHRSRVAWLMQPRTIDNFFLLQGYPGMYSLFAALWLLEGCGRLWDSNRIIAVKVLTAIILLQSHNLFSK